MARSHLDYRITDEELKAKLTPDYPFGCKRTLVCSDFYKALLRDNVELVTERDRPRHAQAAWSAWTAPNGRTDAIVLATGFRATEYLEGIDVVGLDGRRLHEDWSEAAHAYLGLTVSGYPNFFMLYGPNTNQGGNSIIVILEAQAGYVVGALEAMEERGDRRPRRCAARSWRPTTASWPRPWPARCGRTDARATSRTPKGTSSPSCPRPLSGTRSAPESSHIEEYEHA